MASTGKKINELAQISTLTNETVLPGVYVNSGVADSTANKITVQQLSAKVQNDMSGTLADKQDKLTAGTNISIENNVISSTADSLPSQTGNSGKFLTTDGSSASWATVSTGADTSLTNLTDSGKETAAHLAMPSDVYDELTPVDQQIYTAPADGLFYAIALSNAVNGDLYIFHYENDEIFSTSKRVVFYENDSYPKVHTVSYLAHAGEKVKLGMDHMSFSSATYENLGFRFFYAEGSKHLKQNS